MLKSLYKANVKYKNQDLVNVITIGLSDLKNETEDMSEEDKEMEKPGEITDIVKESLQTESTRVEIKNTNTRSNA